MKLRNLLALALLAVTLGLGCGNGNSNGGGGGGSTQTVDMALGDRSTNNATSQIFLWFDVLVNQGPTLPLPDVTLDPGDRSVTNLYFYNGDLYAATSSSDGATGGILIYRDYLNLVDGDTPDVVLYDAADPLLGPETIQRIALESDVMVGTTWYTTDGIYVWDNAGSVTDGQAPDVFLDDTSMGLVPAFSNCLQDVRLLNGRLFIASCNSGTDVALGIWNDVQDILTNGDTQAPDELLTDDDNFLGLGYGMRTLEIDPAGALYVGEYYGYTIYKFNDASAMTAASLPDIVITGCEDGAVNNTCDLDTTNAMKVVNDTLFVANNNQNFDDGQNPGVVGFLTASNLADNQIPSIFLTRDSAIGMADRLASAGGALFISGVELDPYEQQYRSVHVYKDSSTIVTSRPADLTLLGSQNTDITYLEYPTAVAATVRGTFDNTVDFGT